MRKEVIIAGLALLLIAIAALSRFVSPVDIVTGKERMVGEKRLPNGDTIQIIQYWNEGDFYNLNLTHITKSGTKYECVIDPDCFRVTKCNIKVDPAKAEATIFAKSDKIAACYRWESKEIIRRNGVLIQADLVH